MSKKEKHQHAKAQVQDTKIPSKEGLLIRLDAWLEKNDKKVFYSLLVLSTLFSLLLFDSKVSEGGDDSSYIQRAWSLLHEGTYPYFQGPGYPVFLSLFVKMFGLNVIALKFFSVLCQFGFVWFTYRSFVKRIPYTVLFAMISYISFNHFIQYYSSQTFTETFFLFVQALCIYITFKILDSINQNDSLLEELKKNYMKWLLFGLLFVLLSISKSIAFVAIAAVVIYFVLNKNYKHALYAIIAFALIRVIYQLAATSIFGPSEANQVEMMLRKQLYKPEAGHEDFAGLVTRFFDNFNTYISLHMYRLLNLRNADTDAREIIPALSYVSAIILAIFSYLSYRKNKYVFFACIYLIVMCAGIFIGVQAANMQDRLIIIVMPLIFLMLFYGAYELAKRSPMSQSLLAMFAGIMMIITIGKSSVIAQKNITALKRNLNGDIYYGYTPDWENFLKMSKYCADSLPDSTHVLSRKPNMSFIYADGKKFDGQYWVTTTNVDSIAMEWKAKKIEYVIVASLRMNPKKNNGRVINTIHRMLGPYAKAHPERVRLVKKIGDVEKCELYKVTY